MKGSRSDRKGKAPETAISEASESSSGVAFPNCRNRSIVDDVLSIELYQLGGVVNGVRRPGNPAGVGGGTRGRIHGWSMASRRRLREAMVKYSPPDDWPLLAVTLTIPGPAMSLSESKLLFEKWRKRIEYRGFTGIWRIEVQGRGQFHWHLILGGPPDLIADCGMWPCYPEPIFEKYSNAPRPAREAAILLAYWWLVVLDESGPVRAEIRRLFDPGEAATMLRECASSHPVLKRVPSGDGPAFRIEQDVSRARWKGEAAARHAIDVQCCDGSGAWYRYLGDHTSKCKQEQIPDDYYGRPWGKINSKALVRRFPDSVVELELPEFRRFARWLQRLATPSIKCPQAPFGRKLGYSNRRGSFGRSIWFTRPEIMARLAAFALESSV